MSGITGKYDLGSRPVDRADIDRMVGAIAHRGPNGLGVWHAGPVGLGHCLLVTTSEPPRLRPPIVGTVAGCVITADARIDNRDELIRAIEVANREPREISDAEIILASYDRWGERCVDKLLGDFAFAIWDQRRQLLFCARDHFGVKPFYYYHAPGRVFAFASEIKSLLCLPELPRQIDDLQLASYLVGAVDDKASTFYRGILRLPPAHCMVVSRDTLRVWSYWSLDPARELHLGSDEAYAEAFRDIFTTAVCCRLRGGPLGAMLSGGLDSSSIVCAARDALGHDTSQHLHTFSAIFPSLAAQELARIDERAYIDAVLATGHFVANDVRGDQLSPLCDVERLLWHEDQPPIAPNLFLNVGLHNAAQRAGVRVLLDGFGGDSVVSHGTGYLVELIDLQQWSALAHEIDALARRSGFSPAQYLDGYVLPYLAALARRGSWIRFARTARQIGRRYGMSRRDLWLRYGVSPLMPTPALRAWRGLRRREHLEDDGRALLKSDLYRRTRFGARLRGLEAEQKRVSITARDDQRLELDSGIFPLVFEENDHVAAACSIEARYPFFDKRLVEFCLSLPANQKLRDGWDRFVLRNAMSGVLPSMVQWRSGKADLSSNFTRGLLGPDRAILEDVLLHDPAAVGAYVDVGVLQGAYRRYVADRGSDAELVVWRVAMLGFWLRCSEERPLPGMPVHPAHSHLATHTPEELVSYTI
jgi:asparagine synthase (glutamine-hydrolysing)